MSLLNFTAWFQVPRLFQQVADAWPLRRADNQPNPCGTQLATDYCIGGLTRKHVSLSDRVTIGEYALSPTKAAHVSPDPIALSLRPRWA
jgi:hypothetical protein